jgi:recombinational DNA repair protein (RecF pathway)
MEMTMATVPKCAGCGRFVNPDKGRFRYIPDSDYSVEACEWFCGSCSDRKQETPARDTLVDEGIVPASFRWPSE